jgi:hypothetical protein
MISQRKVAANRQNARASTGPRSTLGKKTSARNARRHGLAAPIWADPQASADAEKLALQIAGPNVGAEVMTAAPRVAEAHIDILRVRQVVTELISPGLTDEPFCPPKAFSRIPSGKELELMQGPPCPQKLGYVLADSWDDLQKIERYERRALSRRKFAIRDFDMAVAQNESSAETA